MIKSEVTVCAAISRSASVKQTKDGQSFVSFGVTIPITGRDGSTANLDISVTMDGDMVTAARFTTGRRVQVLGILTVRKKGDNTYFNLKAEGGVELAKSTEPDSIEGTLEFMGKVGKKGVENHVDGKNRPFQTFSAWSSDHDGENIEFIWVRFLNFQPQGEDFMSANGYITAKGDLQISVYKSTIGIDCRVKELSAWKKKR